MVFTLTDYVAADYDGSGMVDAQVRAGPIMAPYQENFDGTWKHVDFKARRVAEIDDRGKWTLHLPTQSGGRPSTQEWMIELPDNTRYKGPIPDDLDGLTKTLQYLIDVYDWGLVATPDHPVVAIQGIPGMLWRGVWSSATDYDPRDVVEYGGSSWIARAHSTNVVPGTDSNKWELVVSVEGAIAGGDLTGTYLSPNLDLTRGHVWTGLQTGPLRDKGGARFNVQAYGAVGDGTTDDTVAIQAAWNAAAAVGGITYLPAGTFAVDPAALGEPPTSLHLLGDGYKSCLKIKDGVNNFRSLFIWSGATTGVTIRNLRFDGNASGYGGTIQTNPAQGDYETRTARMLLFIGAATDLSVTDCWFTNACGVHVMLANNANNARVRFDRNTIIWSMNPGNLSASQDYDNSMVYITGPSHITTNSFIHPTIPTPPFGARGAIETIGGPTVVSNNLFINFRTPIYLTGSFTFPASGSIGESVVSGNTMSGANQAIRIWPSIQGGKISITGNQIRIAQVTHNRLNCCGIWVEDDPSFNAPIADVSITGNTITFEDEPAAGRPTDYQGSALTATDCVGIGAPSFNTVAALSISGNVIKGAPAYGIVLGRMNLSRASTVRNVLARNNQIINAGQNMGLGNTSRAGVFLTGNCENVIIAANQIADTWGAFSTLPYSNAGAGTFLSSQQYWFAFDLSGAAGTSQGSTPVALTPQTNNTQIKVGVRLDNANITTVGIYADTVSAPKRVGTIAVAWSGSAWSIGAITYDGASSGLSAALSGSGLTTSTLTITLSNPQSGSSVGASGVNGTGSGAAAIPLTRGFYGIFTAATGTSFTAVQVRDNSLYVSAPLHGGGTKLQTSLVATVNTGQAWSDSNGGQTFALDNSGNITTPGTFTATGLITGNGGFSTPGAITATGNVQGSRLISTVANGTAPLGVTSATKVANLNADLLDGLDSTALNPATTTGDLVYASGNGAPSPMARLPIGTASQVLIGGATPSWGVVPDAALSANVPLENAANIFGAAQTINLFDAGTNTEPTLLTIRHRTSGTAAVGFGSSIAFSADSNNATIRTQSSLISSWLDATDASRRAILQFFASDATTAREGLRIASNGTAAQLGFFGHSGAIRPSVSGALSAVTDANAKAVLQSIVNALKAASGGVGLVTDATT
jgi:hypothetical protein